MSMISVALHKFLPVPSPANPPDPQVGTSHPLVLGMNALADQIAKSHGITEHTYLKLNTFAPSVDDQITNMWADLYARPLGGSYFGCINNHAGQTSNLQILTARQNGTVSAISSPFGDAPRATICTYRSNATEN